MEKETFTNILNLFNIYCDLCIDNNDYLKMSLDEIKVSLNNFIDDYINCMMDSYLSKLICELSEGRSSWDSNDYKNFADLLLFFNLKSRKNIVY